MPHMVIQSSVIILKGTERVPGSKSGAGNTNPSQSGGGTTQAKRRSEEIRNSQRNRQGDLARQKAGVMTARGNEETQRQIERTDM